MPAHTAVVAVGQARQSHRWCSGPRVVGANASGISIATVSGRREAGAMFTFLRRGRQSCFTPVRTQCLNWGVPAQLRGPLPGCCSWPLCLLSYPSLTRLSEASLCLLVLVGGRGGGPSIMASTVQGQIWHQAGMPRVTEAQ